jgi:hypothetical protein
VPALTAGQARPCGGYLEQHIGLRADRETLLDLIFNEFVLREQLGDVPRVGEYLGRFPNLAPQLRIQFALDQALQERPAFVSPPRTGEP